MQNKSCENELKINKLMVQSDDGKISNLLCPIELVSEAKNYSSPLIPDKYDPVVFSGFQNVSANSFTASTPKIISRKRKTHQNSTHQFTQHQKKRKLSKIMRNKIHTNHYEDFDPNDFSFQPDLMIHSRPKRQRKNISYKEMDSNAFFANYVPLEPKKTAKRPKLQTPFESVVRNAWVQCDKCSKWRRIPSSISSKQFEGKWICSMNKWDLKRNSCSANEEQYSTEQVV